MTIDARDKWHLDKRVPIGIIFAMLGQMAGALWFASKLDSRILALEAATLAQHDRDERQDRTNSEGMSMVHRQLERIDEKLDRLIEKGRK
jgi:hypothetical protein